MGADVSMGALILGRVADYGMIKVTKEDVADVRFFGPAARAGRACL